MSSLCDYSDIYIYIYIYIYILAKETITVANTADTALNNANNFTRLYPYLLIVYKINSTQVLNAKYIDVIMPIYNLTLIWVGFLEGSFLSKLPPA